MKTQNRKIHTRAGNRFILPVVAGPGSEIPDNIKGLGEIDISSVCSQSEYAESIFLFNTGKFERMREFTEKVIALLWQNWVPTPTTAWRLNQISDRTGVHHQIIAYECKETPFTRKGNRLYLTPHNTKLDNKYELRFDKHLLERINLRADGYKEFVSCPEYDRHIEPFIQVILNPNLELIRHKGDSWVAVYNEWSSIYKKTGKKLNTQRLLGYLPVDLIHKHDTHVYAKTFLLPGMRGTPEYSVIKLYAPELLPLIKEISSHDLPQEVSDVIDRANHGMYFLNKPMNAMKT